MSTNAKTRYNISKVFDRLSLTREVKIQIQPLTTWQVRYQWKNCLLRKKKPDKFKYFCN